MLGWAAPQPCSRIWDHLSILWGFQGAGQETNFMSVHNTPWSPSWCEPPPQNEKVGQQTAMLLPWLLNPSAPYPADGEGT